MASENNGTVQHSRASVTYNGHTYYVFKDGEYMNFYVYSREIFNDGGADTYSYGFWKAYELLSDAITGNNNGIYDIPGEV